MEISRHTEPQMSEPLGSCARPKRRTSIAASGISALAPPELAFVLGGILFPMGT